MVFGRRAVQPVIPPSAFPPIRPPTPPPPASQKRARPPATLAVTAKKKAIAAARYPLLPALREDDGETKSGSDGGGHTDGKGSGLGALSRDASGETTIQ